MRVSGDTELMAAALVSLGALVTPYAGFVAIAATYGVGSLIGVTVT